MHMQLILLTTIEGRYLYPYFRSKETEAQGDSIICPSALNYDVAEPHFKFWLFNLIPGSMFFTTSLYQHFLSTELVSSFVQASLYMGFQWLFLTSWLRHLMHINTWILIESLVFLEGLPKDLITFIESNLIIIGFSPVLTLSPYLFCGYWGISSGVWGQGALQF